MTQKEMLQRLDYIESKIDAIAERFSKLQILHNSKDAQRPSADYLTTEEFCEVVKVSRTTVFKWIKDGLISKRKVGRKTYIHRDQVNKVFNSSDITI